MSTSMRGDPGVAKLVERQMRNWELARSQHVEQPVTLRPEVADFICISREAGVGANRIGSMLGEKLGWPVFEREILHEMAKGDAIRERIYASMDERDVTWCENTLRSLMQPEFVKNDYLHSLCRTILSLARQGNAIFIGRRADLILPMDHGLRVRIVAPMAMRIEHVMGVRGLSADAAEGEINRIDGEREAFTRRYFKSESSDPRVYDLTINLRGFSIRQAVDLILAARTMRQ